MKNDFYNPEHHALDEELLTVGMRNLVLQTAPPPSESLMAILAPHIGQVIMRLYAV